MNHRNWPSEMMLAMNDFAAWMRRHRPRAGTLEDYEVRPCRKVRGFMLRLPLVGWQFWFPSATSAVQFAQRVAAIYSAQCLVYDDAGLPRSSYAPTGTVAPPPRTKLRVPAALRVA